MAGCTNISFNVNSRDVNLRDSTSLNSHFNITNMAISANIIQPLHL